MLHVVGGAITLTLGLAGCGTDDFAPGTPHREPLRAEAPAHTKTVAADSPLAVRVGSYQVRSRRLIATAGEQLEMATWDSKVKLSEDVTSFSTLKLSLPGGDQPEAPVQVVHRLPMRVPAGASVVVGRSESNDGPMTMIPSDLSQDRRSVSFRTSHFSWFDTIVVRGIPALLGTRGSEPTCEDPRTPRWVSDVIYPDTSSGDMPMLVCAGRDPADQDLVVVKVTNNRGTGMAMTASKDWAWVWTGGAGGVKATVADWFSEISDPEADRTVFLMPGQQAHFAFREGDWRDMITLQGTVSVSSAAYGMAWDLLQDLEVSAPTRTVLAGVFLTVCFADAELDPLARAGVSDLRDLAIPLARCVVESYDDIVEAANRELDADAWDRTFGDLKGKWHRVRRRASAALALAVSAHRLGDSAADVLQDPYARRVTIASVIPPRGHRGGSPTATPVPAESEAPEATYVPGSPFEDSCVVAWPTAPLRTSTSISMRMSCAGVPGEEFLFTDVTLDDPSLVVTPSTGALTVRGVVEDTAASGYGYNVLLVRADQITVG